MKQKNIERNQLDYILTDVLPVELSGQFSFYYFYEYFIEENKKLEDIKKSITKDKNKNITVFKGNKWVSMPLKYTIMKQSDTERVISLLQPLGAVELYLFICAYQKELLILLEKNSIFTIRYHRKNNDLYYKSRNKSITEYFSDLSDKLGKEIIEQTGMYFNLFKYNSLSDFTASEEWLISNNKYKYFIRSDYKRCFDSIYTHSYNWIIGKDVNDAKNFNNASVYNIIDRVLMNINGRTSNGIVVGPEFSRMVAELLLQTIDMEVYSALLNKNIFLDEEYKIFRYVDDLFIFANTENIANEIVDTYSKVSRKYLLELNESKLIRRKVPFVLDPWLKETNFLTNSSSALLFFTREEWEERKPENKIEDDKIKPYVLKTYKGNYISTLKLRIMRQFNELICNHESKAKTIVSYFLGMMLNKIGRDKEKVNIFHVDVSTKVVFEFLEISVYVYSFFPNYSNTHKLLSIISYINDEFNVVDKSEELQRLFDKYEFIFEKANLNDIIDLILFFGQAKIEIPYKQEEKIVEKLYEKDDPILWASYLLYSNYSDKYCEYILKKIKCLLEERIDSIINLENVYSYREFWWVLIFNQCPYLKKLDGDKLQDDKLQVKINDLLTNLYDNNIRQADENRYPADEIEKIFLEFLRNNPRQFFEWEWDMDKRNFLRNITFKTRQRTIFKNYKENLLSVNWDSLWG